MQAVFGSKFKILDWTFGIFLFCSALLLGPLRQLEFFRLMPGDVVDARLNLVFLENIYAYFSGRVGSLIHLGFFYPYPYVSAFSDNLFGAAPVYMLARLCSLTPEGAFQVWFILGYLVNFLAACYSFRLLGQSRSASAIGAVLFTFGLPVSAQMGHAQLQYRFGLALAIAYFYKFLNNSDWRLFLISCCWLVWQFFCSIYLGFFACLFMAALFIFFLVQQVYESRSGRLGSATLPFAKFLTSFVKQSFSHKLQLLVGVGFALIALLGLFLPYLEVTKLYRFARTWMEVSAMSPRIFSYLLADHSLIWGAVSKKIQGVPIRWEQQLFIGLAPLVVLCWGAYQACRPLWPPGRLFLLIISFLFLVLLTLNFQGHSLWQVLVALPLFSAIRALSRIILLFLFPLSVLLAAAVDLILKNSQFNKNYFLFVLSSLLVLEVSAVQATTSSKEEWLARSELESARLVDSVPLNPILFFSQRDLSFEREELDAMIVAQKRDLPTLNGYSGALPHHFSAQYGDDCAEYPRRILLYLEFTGRGGDNLAYRQLAQRVAPIGFVGCEEGWRKEPPMTFARQPLSREAMSHLSLELAPAPKRNSEFSNPQTSYLALKIVNSGLDKISALSLIDRPLRLAWRLNDKNGAQLVAWTQPRQDQPPGLLPQGYRRDLPGDIPAGGAIEILAPIPEEVLRSEKTLQFTLVEEATIWGFSLLGEDTLWAHDVGVTPLTVDLSQL